MYSTNSSDSPIEVSGLSVILEDEEQLPYLELTLRCNGRGFRASILVAEDEWALRMREEGGPQVPTKDAMYPTQADAIVAAMLTTLEVGTRTL